MAAMKLRCRSTVPLLLLGGVCTALAAEGAGSGGEMTHRMALLALQLGTILFAAKIGSLLCLKAKLPGIVGELLAGVMIGPYCLGKVVLPGLPGGLFPIASESFPISAELYGICALASVVLLFLVGLDTDIRLFMRYSLVGSLVGIGGVAASFLLGDGMAVLLSPMLFGEQLGALSPPCLFLGIISTATSVGISARILSESRKLDSAEGVTILSGAVVDDVLGIILLAMAMGIVSASRGSDGIDWLHIGAIAGKAVGIWLAATIAGLLCSRKIGTLLKWFKDRSAIAVLALGLALLLAGFFEQFGLAMIIGAYVVGLSLARTDINHVVRERLQPLHTFLVPVFFTVMGMLVDVRLLVSPPVLLFGLIYTVVADVAKVAGCGLPALFCNFNARGALRVGVGMLPRGEVTLIIAGTGLAAGLLNREVFGVVILMVLLTALVAPPCLVALLRPDASGLRRPEEEGRGELPPFRFPSVAAADLMVSKLLAAFESEGFFVHTLNRAARIYQLRKDRAVMGFRQQGADIIFDCNPDEVPFVSAAVYEVLAEFEQTIRELKKPVDVRSIGRRIQERPPGTAVGGGLGRYVSPGLLIPRLEGRTKQEVIRELLTRLDTSGLVRGFDAAYQAVWTREESMSTGMQYGIAIPHGRTDTVDRLVCAVGLKPGGVDFDSIDGEPARIIVLTLSPQRAAAPHVQFMSTVSQLLTADGRDRLLECRTPEQMYELLTGAAMRASNTV